MVEGNRRVPGHAILLQFRKRPEGGTTVLEPRPTLRCGEPGEEGDEVGRRENNVEGWGLANWCREGRDHRGRSGYKYKEGEDRRKGKLSSDNRTEGDWVNPKP